jgi:hypothetical protein
MFIQDNGTNAILDHNVTGSGTLHDMLIRVGGNTAITIDTTPDVTISNALNVSGTTTLSGNLLAVGSLTISGDTSAHSDMYLAGTNRSIWMETWTSPLDSNPSGEFVPVITLQDHLYIGDWEDWGGLIDEVHIYCSADSFIYLENYNTTYARFGEDGSTAGTYPNKIYYNMNVNARFGVGTTYTSAMATIDQNSSTAAIPVMSLDQADVDEPFIKFIGTAAANTTNSIVDIGDVSTSALSGFVKVEIYDSGNRITDQDYYMPVYVLT